MLLHSLLLSIPTKQILEVTAEIIHALARRLNLFRFFHHLISLRSEPDNITISTTSSRKMMLTQAGKSLRPCVSDCR